MPLGGCDLMLVASGHYTYFRRRRHPACDGASMHINTQNTFKKLLSIEA